MSTRFMIWLTGMFVSTFALATDPPSGCAVRQLVANSEIILTNGEISQVFNPCQTGILEFVNVDARSASDQVFGIRLVLVELGEAGETVIHRQQSMAPAFSTELKTVFSLSSNIRVEAEKTYRLDIQVPGNQETLVKFSASDSYPEGNLVVNDIRFPGDLSFEAGINPLHFYERQANMTGKVPQHWTVDMGGDDYSSALAQSRFDGSELMLGASYGQTFVSDRNGCLEAIWFHGSFVNVENQIPVHLWDKSRNKYIGFAKLEQHPEEKETLIARFGDIHLKANTEYEFMLDCGERQQIELHLVSQPQYFVGHFRQMEEPRDANLSFIAFLE